jgi:hypothetical protein
MSSDRPDRADPDPGRRLMLAALVGVAVLALAVIAAMGYFVWQRINADRETASKPAQFVAAIANVYRTSDSRGCPP